MVEKQIGKVIKILCSNQGGEYKLGNFIKYCRDHGIIQQFIVPHTPQQNEVAERKNITLVDCALNMLKGKDLSNGFWVEAINTAVYLKSRSPTKSLDLKTPFEALYGFKPTVSHLRVFGLKAFSHTPKEDRKKLDAKAIKSIFVGYCSEFKAYKLFNPSSHKVFSSRDVILHEQVDEGNIDKGYEEWHMPLLIEDSNDEAKDNHVQQQQQK